MRRRLCVDFLIMGTGMLLQIIYWKTDVFFIGIIGNVLFVAGIVMFRKTAIDEKKIKDSKKSDAPGTDCESCK